MLVLPNGVCSGLVICIFTGKDILLLIKIKKNIWDLVTLLCLMSESVINV